MASDKPLIAFFGATGGCCAAALARSLIAGYPCTALARTPSKLIDLLYSKGVSRSNITAQLSITKGDVRDVDSVQTALSSGGETASIIISGIGVYTLSPTTICTTATTTILTALSLLRPTIKPLLLVISTTGISTGPRDVPLPFLPLYKVFLANPHEDKRAMEQTLAHALEAEMEAWIREFVVVRPSLLTNGPALGKEKVRVGTEYAPSVGYTISREDVGNWVFENVVGSEERERWVGEKVCLTY